MTGCHSVQYQRQCMEATSVGMVHRECFHIHSVKPRPVPIVFVAEGSFDGLCIPGGPRGVLLGIDLADHGKTRTLFCCRKYHAVCV